MIVENSGLLTVAALKHIKAEKKKVVSILSGGNMDVITLSSIVQHGLIQRDRVFTVSVLLPDKPGELARVSSLLAEQHGNIIKLEHPVSYTHLDVYKRQGKMNICLKEDMKMGIKELMSHVDHTLLAQTATWEEIRQICDDAVAYQLSLIHI